MRSRRRMREVWADLCLTDHLDFDPPAGVADFTFDVPSQQTAIDEDVEFLGLNGRGGKYGDFQLLKGVEIGLQDKSMSTIRKILADNRFDCVIASLHLIDRPRSLFRGLL